MQGRGHPGPDSAGDDLSIAVAHRFTERRSARSPLDVSVLRNGLYAELFAGLAAPTRSSGVLDLPGGSGTFAPVAREDLADAAARVVADIGTGPGAVHVGAVYELDGVESVDGPLVAAAMGAYEPSDMDEIRRGMSLDGVPPYQAAHVMSIHATIHAGLLTSKRTVLPSLLDRPPRRPLDVIAGRQS